MGPVACSLEEKDSLCPGFLFGQGCRIGTDANVKIHLKFL